MWRTADRSSVELAGGLTYYHCMPYYYSNSPSVSFGGPITKTVKTLIMINVVVWVLQVLAR
ncbi:MAG: hypothetical protein ABSH28_22625, partial [Acidobacteriota bacterium]